MLLYIEGLDKAGKSTFAERLSVSLGIEVYRKIPPKELTLKEHHSYFKGVGFALVEIHNILKQSLIVDRSFISDWIYSNRKKNVFPIRIWKEWEDRHTESNHAIIIYVETSSKLLKKRLLHSPDPYMVSAEIPRFLSLYEIYFQTTQFHVIRIDGSATESEQQQKISAIAQILKSNSRHKPRTCVSTKLKK